MNKETKKAYELMTKKENDKAGLVAKLEKELSDLKTKHAELEKKTASGTDAGEYIKALGEMRDIETAINFFEKKLSEAKAAPVLTDDEYSKIKADAKAIFETIKAEQAATILKEIETLNKLLAAFDADTADINKMLTQAAALRGGQSALTLNAQTLAQDLAENKYYIDAFYKVKGARELFKLKGIKV